MMEKFSTWLLQKIEERGWSQAELARRAGLGNATVNRFITETHNPGSDACLAIARALKVPPEEVFRIAGILPRFDETRVREFQEVSEMLASLPDPIRKQTMIAIRALARDAYERALKEEEEKERK
jgi:transcriptional regulator with XRE-family HTH domain